tara:strand:- start:335 stop:568 length:234 start_codon:yes stop_codon:yes gene_type:complete
MKYQVDEWVTYCAFPDSEFSVLSEERIESVILEVLDNDLLYDYRICLNDGSAKITKAKEKNLFDIKNINLQNNTRKY